MAKIEKPFLKLLWHIVLAALVAMGVQIAGSAIIGAVLNEFDNQLVKNLISDSITMAVYAVCFYRFHQYPRLDTYIEHPQKPDAKGELLAYIRAEGKYLFIVYGACAVLHSVIFYLLPPGPLLLVDFFFIETVLTPMIANLHIPMILDSVLGFIYACAVACGLVLLRSRKIHEEDRLARRR